MALLRLCALLLPAAAGGVTLSLPSQRQEAAALVEDDAPGPQAAQLALTKSAAASSAAAVSALVQALQSGEFDGNASARLDGVLTLGDRLTRESWLATGPEALQALKARVFKRDDFRSRARSACPSEGGDCSFRQGCLLFCEALQLAASEEKLGNMATLEKLISATTMSTRFYGVDTVTQSALIARWDKEDQWVSRFASTARRADSAFESLRRRLTATSDFQELVRDTCTELSSIRPQCLHRASDGAFCQALGQAAAVSVGPQEAARRIGEALQGL